MSLDDKDTFIKSIGDEIKMIQIDDEKEVYNAYVSVTTIREQTEKSYFTSDNVFDCCLYPGEKVNMMFALVNGDDSQ
jgi:hypothetical protein